MQYQSSAKKELTINNRKFEYFDLNSIVIKDGKLTGKEVSC